ncbi:acetyl-coenzyme A synthetase 2-like, mitochondrial [Lingula anatina]|uniref:Acetyl-coenzyme A synthetase n=1 Tax=Lingula anatina TaxID=7574 RepID=A0A1S3HR03_LINAN|nr:acetyl-coenzyme A synthetase 2-like, mitochondrial [Lingula anatina]|eukprot:XP_013387971.1 acetyl-coenzyme A synthetase 2-like, mitochondrial [Lingula anatina]
MAHRGAGLCRGFSRYIKESKLAACSVKKWPIILRRTMASASSPICTTYIPEFDGTSGIKSYQDLHDLSLRDPDLFWGRLARSRVKWMTDFDQVQKCDMEKGDFKWFLGGKLNVTESCIDRHVESTPNKVALIWEKDEPGTEEHVTYKELYHKMNQIANMLKDHGVKRGDPVAIYMPVSPLLVASMLACARIGAVHSVVFAGFSAESLAARINDAGAETVITSDFAVRGGKLVELKNTVDAALEKCPGVKRVFMATRTNKEVSMGEKDFLLKEEMAQYPEMCIPEKMDSEDTLFMLYTSGSTGKPKGLVHTQAGYIVYTTVTHQMVFNYQPEDIFACVADIGWITGHSYGVYGPLSNGATSVLFESTPTYPDPGRYWEMVERLKVNILYLAPTALRLLLKSGDSFVTKYDRSSLKTLGCVGEPLNREAFEWYHDIVGEKRCDVVDTWWQTETGGILISPRPSAPGAEIRPGMPMRPFFGVDPVLLNEKGEELTDENVSGALCLRKPWPGIARTIHGSHERFLDVYFKMFPGVYFTGDGAHRHEGGHYQITGRMDDVINVSGHRLGTAEIEDAIDEHPSVAESAVVGFPHEIKGEGVYAYVTLKDDATQTAADIIPELRNLIKTQIASYAVPDIILIAPGLPKTRSGKIMRRILRKIAASQHDDLGDISTLAEPGVVQVIVDHHNEISEKKSWL